MQFSKKRIEQLKSSRSPFKRPIVNSSGRRKELAMFLKKERRMERAISLLEKLVENPSVSSIEEAQKFLNFCKENHIAGNL